MKKTICYLLVVILVFGACVGCGKKDKEKTDSKKQDKVEAVIGDTALGDDASNDEPEESDGTEQQPVTEESKVEQKQPQNQSQNKNQSQQQQNQSQQRQEVTEQAIVNPTITTSATNVNLDNSAQVVNITLSHLDVGDVRFDIADTSICSCQWGNWSGNTIPLTITPLKTGNTTVTVSLPSYNKSVAIGVAAKITTPADLSSLTIDKVGNTYERWFHGTVAANKFVLNSAEYKITSRSNGNVNIHIDLTASCVECNYSSYYIQILYELYNSSGVCIKSHYIFKQFTHLNQLYSDTIDFYDLEPGDYTLKFMSGY